MIPFALFSIIVTAIIGYIFLQMIRFRRMESYVKDISLMRLIQLKGSGQLSKIGYSIISDEIDRRKHST